MQSKYFSMTLLEIYYDVKCDMEKHFGWQDSTKKEYETNYQKLSEYLNDKPFFEYDLDDFYCGIGRSIANFDTKDNDYIEYRLLFRR